MAATAPIFSRSGKDERELDPFGYFPELISRVGGIGNSGAIEDPSYAFHTPYVGLSKGTHRYRVQFENLRGREGTMIVSVNELAHQPHPAVTTLKTIRLPLRDLAHRYGRLELEIQTRPDRTYAVFGGVEGPSDACADALTVTIAEPRPAGGQSSAEAAPGGRPMQAAPRLVSLERPTLANPVSQVCTAAQFDEPSYDSWLSFLHLPKRRHRAQWETVFVLQALKRYGALRPGVRALGLGVAGQTLPAALATLGCEVTAIDQLAGRDGQAPAEGLDRLRRPEICPEGRFLEAIRFRCAQLEPLQPDLKGFDMVWCTSLISHVGSAQAAFDLAEAALLSLRPGGLAIFTTPFRRAPVSALGDCEESRPLRRTEVERFALSMLGLGHDVAQLRYAPLPPGPASEPRTGAGSDEEVTSLGLIVRRGDLT